MPLTIRLADLSTPQAWIIPDSSPISDGLMTKIQAAQLKALVNGGGAPGPFVTWSSLGFFDSYISGGAPFGVAESRVQGDMVVMAGIVVAPMAGIVGRSHITNLPADQRPSKARIMTCSYQVGSGTPVINTIGVDDAAGSITGTPGAVVLGFDIAAGGALIFLDGLSFVL